MLALVLVLVAWKRRKSRNASNIAFRTISHYIEGAGRNTGPFLFEDTTSMQTVDSAFVKELRKLSAEKINDYMGMLAANNYTTVAEFRYVMGKISALRDLEEMFDEAKKAADQRNR